MAPIERYAVTIPGTPGAHAPPRVVVVHFTHTTGADGRPVYADESGTFRVYVSAGVAEPLADPPGGRSMQCLHAVPVP
ncbi:DUF6296 family protein [Streptomyces sp. CB01881]|uniref:DUF6296 family protein n=1 Tax=Streptomyces sp. CB01881 TaxID=2078691 RepID=UPI0011DF94A9|nr:DUF6296 family protein [Streptomyces sp. CB01881]TYC76378.1 hypothetical protein EH183_01775 [Streptomyces sp. CB01881]